MKWYIEHDLEKSLRGKNPVLYESKDGYRLTTAEKKRILLNNIYGVDIDPQAVEVTKLSLSLKVLEGESEQTIGSQLSLIQERALPDLGRNIKCGNSLVGPDYYEGHQLTMSFADDEERYRVNAFDWKGEFPQVFIQGGFDVVIGNPPYGATLNTEDLKYLRTKFVGLSHAWDTYELFMLHCSEMLSKTGRLGMIIPASWLTGESYHESRKKLVTDLFPLVAYAMPFDVFAAAYIDTAIVIFSHSNFNNKTLIHFFPKKEKLTAIPKEIGTEVNVQSIRDDELHRLTVLLSDVSTPILKKLKNTGLTFGDWFEIQRGVQPYSRSKHTEAQIKSKFLHASSPLTDEYMPELQGNELSRYWTSPERKSYLRYSNEIASTRSKKMFQGHRIVVRRLLTRKFRLQASAVAETLITTDNVLNAIPINENANVIYALGILNSKLISWLYVNTSMIAQKDDFPQVHISALKGLPIPTADKARHEKMVSLVERMLALHKRSPKTPQEQEMVKREVESTDRAIDRLVYELYGLSDEEVKIVEGQA